MADDISYVSLFLMFITVLSASLIGGYVTVRFTFSHHQSRQRQIQPNMNTSNSTQSITPTHVTTSFDQLQSPNTNVTLAPLLYTSSPNATTIYTNIPTILPDITRAYSEPILTNTDILPPMKPILQPLSSKSLIPPNDPELQSHHSSKSQRSRKAKFDELNAEILKFPDRSGSRVTERTQETDFTHGYRSLSLSSSSLDRMSDLEKRQKQKIIIVCYKLPIQCTYNTTTQEWSFKWDDVRNILSNLRVLRSAEYDIAFVGWPGVLGLSFEEEDVLEDAMYSLKYRCYPIFLTNTQIRDCYKVYCRGILWPLFHYKLPTNESKLAVNYEKYWQSYVGLNNLYAKKACVAATDNDDDDDDGGGGGDDDHDNGDNIIWFHNYHLFLAPHFVRRTIPLAQIGLFVHTTFPTSEIFRSLPTTKEILRGILSSDLVGFHTYDYCRHFLSSCKRILDLDAHTLPEDGTLAVHYLGRDVSLRIAHASILSQEIHRTAQSRQVAKYRDSFYSSITGGSIVGDNRKKIILGIGELDQVRGTMLTIEAFKHFLVSYPSWHRDVHFVLCVSPSTLDDYNDESDEYLRNLREPIEAEIAQMNLQYANVINLINMDGLSYCELLGLYTLCDVAVFGTFWDGFNTIPYELTAAQPPSMSTSCVPPAVILSEYMGCMRSLCGVFRINPWKINEVAATLHSALCMTVKERMVAHHRRFSHVMSYSFIDWCMGFISDLRKASKNECNKRVLPIGFGSNLRFIYIPRDLQNLKQKETFAKLMGAFRQCKYKILLLDYGGTLTDVDEMDGISTDLQSISPKILASLRAISSSESSSSDGHTIVAIISGQTRCNLSSAFAECPGLLICAEKGAYFRFPGAGKEWVKNDKLMDDHTIQQWQNIVYSVLKTYTERTNGSYIQKKSTALVWHYKNADPHFGDMQANEAERYLTRIIDHKKHYKLVVQRYDHGRALEVLPQEIHKGSASLSIMAEMMKIMDKDGAGGDDASGDNMFIMSVGNDRSDEKMFEAVELASQEILKTKHQFTVKIGIAPTQARYYLNDQNEMLWLLNTLANQSISSRSMTIPIPIPIPPIQPLCDTGARRSCSYSRGLADMDEKEEEKEKDMPIPIPPTADYAPPSIAMHRLTPVDDDDDEEEDDDDEDGDALGPIYHGSMFDSVTVRSHSYHSLSTLKMLHQHQ